MRKLKPTGHVWSPGCLSHSVIQLSQKSRLRTTVHHQHQKPSTCCGLLFPDKKMPDKSLSEEDPMTPAADDRASGCISAVAVSTTSSSSNAVGGAVQDPKASKK